MNVITVNINGVEYNLKGEEKEEYLQKVAGYVDKKIKLILENNPKLSVTSAAVLSTVNAVDDLFKCDSAYRDLLDELEELKVLKKNLSLQLKDSKEEVDKVEEEKKQLLAKVNSQDENILKDKDTEIDKLKEELSKLRKEAKEAEDKCLKYKEDNRELKFQLQTAKFKVIDLQNKLVDKQIDLVKAKKIKNPLLNENK
ncbi:cell division protein ZapA [Clostridium sp. 19966]|uniref:cell division protein ZapA n=1 Tax=Clostridium sp. 19966 TaxID=2768166 RepID=UPI0028DFFB34|nr:cell division protein ZapA [Clostridium sp. 19966]MDT8716522.1 cell division protein ZapA [Clostridium sp. 19966]